MITRILLFLILGVLPLAAQQEVEIRRAEPVRHSGTNDEAERASSVVAPVMPFVSTEPVVLTAPVEKPVSPEPEVRRAERVGGESLIEPAETDAGAGRGGRSSSGEPVSMPDAMRAVPADADAATLIFQQANNYFAQKKYELAIPQYMEFLGLERLSDARQAALFRLGESQRALKRVAEALGAYQQLLQEFRDGEFFGPAAYRLGELQLAAKNYDEAAASFHLAADHVRDPKLRLASKFFEGRALDSADRKLESLTVYREVVAQKEDNPYRERVMFELADADSRSGLTQSAYRQFLKLAESAEQTQVRTGASVRAGLMAIDSRDFAAARPLLERGAADKEMLAWAQAAQIGLLRLDYEEEKFQEVARRAEQLLETLPAGSKPEVLLLAANAQRQMGSHGQALLLYDRLVSEFPESSSAKEAAFHRLVSLVAQNDERASEQIDAFLKTATDSDQKARASLLKAEQLFAANNFAEAEAFYAAAVSGGGIDKYRADALYKLSWSRLQQGKFDKAIGSLTDFLTQYPRHPLAASAMAQRGMAELQTDQKDAALADFSMIIERFRDSKEREDAMLQRAILLGNMNRQQEMAAAFQRLLNEYPKSKFSAQAQFWMGYIAFEGKKYSEAIPLLEEARKLDKSNYGERATLRILLSHYYLQNREAVAAEAEKLGMEKVPLEVRTWLGMASLQAGDNVIASKYLKPLAMADNTTDELRESLIKAQLGAGEFAEAKQTLEKWLPLVHEPGLKARAHLLMAEAMLGLKDGVAAKDHADSAQKSQPQGRLNAEARLAGAKALFMQERFDDAARAFMAAALLYDEKDITPQSLDLASQAYTKAGNEEDAAKAREELKRRYPSYESKSAH